MSVELRGDKELLRRLKKLNKKELEGALQVMGDHVATQTRIYPVPPKPSYTRTNRLEEGWKVKPKRSDFSVTVSNPVEYAPYVHGDKEQASFHRSYGWKRLKKTATSEMKNLLKILKRDIDQILEGRR